MTALDGLTEEGTGHSFLNAQGMPVHYHEAGDGPPVVFMHAYGPGSTAWLTWHRVLGEFSRHFRCILVDLVNFGKTGPLIYEEPVHSVQARTARDVMDHLGIASAMFVGISVGGTSSLVQALEAPERVTKIVIGGSHASTGGDPYVVANFPSEGSRATRETYANPSREQFVRYLKAHLYDEEMATDLALVDYVHGHWNSTPEHQEAQRRSISTPHSNLGLLEQIKVPVRIVHGRFDRMVTVEQALLLMGYMPQADLVILNRCGHWAPYERPDDYVSHVLPFLLAESPATA